MQHWQVTECRCCQARCHPLIRNPPVADEFFSSSVYNDNSCINPHVRTLEHVMLLLLLRVVGEITALIVGRVAREANNWNTSIVISEPDAAHNYTTVGPPTARSCCNCTHACNMDVCTHEYLQDAVCSTRRCAAIERSTTSPSRDSAARARFAAFRRISPSAYHAVSIAHDALCWLSAQ